MKLKKRFKTNKTSILRSAKPFVQYADRADARADSERRLVERFRDAVSTHGHPVNGIEINAVQGTGHRVVGNVHVHVPGRPSSSRVGFTVRLPSDRLYRGVLGGITVDRPGGYSNLGGEFLDTQYKNGADGELFKLEYVYYPTNTVTMATPIPCMT